MTTCRCAQQAAQINHVISCFFDMNGLDSRLAWLTWGSLMSLSNNQIWSPKALQSETTYSQAWQGKSSIVATTFVPPLENCWLGFFPAERAQWRLVYFCQAQGPGPKLTRRFPIVEGWHLTRTGPSRTSHHWCSSTFNPSPFSSFGVYLYHL